MKTKISILTTLMVSLFGLTSCSPDSGQDSWRLHPPHISDPANPRDTISIAKAHLEIPSASSELVFQDGDLTDATLTITASCRGGSERAEETFIVHRIHRVPLASLWPVALWKNLNASELEAAVCSLRFIATTQRGSTHSFKIEGLRLRGFATFAAESAQRRQGEAWTLLCDGFTTDASEELTSTPTPIIALARRASETAKPLGHQACRLFTRTEDKTTGLSNNRLSHAFQLSFPNPLAKTTIITSYEVIGTPQVSSRALVSVRLENNGSFPIAYRVRTPKTLALQPLVRMTRWDLIASTDRSLVAIQRSDEPLTLTISGESARWSQDGFESFVISPNATVTVSLTLASTLKCLSGTPDLDLPPYDKYLANPPEIARAELAGFYFGFGEPVRLESIDFWSASHPRDQSDSYTPVELSIPRSRQQPFHEGFQGIPEYMKSYDGSGRAPSRNVVVNELATTKWCRIR